MLIMKPSHVLKKLSVSNRKIMRAWKNVFLHTSRSVNKSLSNKRKSSKVKSGTHKFVWGIILTCLWSLTLLILIINKESRGEANLFIIFPFIAIMLVVSICLIANGKRNMYGFNAKILSNKTIDDMIMDVDMMEGIEFEHFCAKLLESNGFSDVLVTEASGDQGVDIIAKKENIKYAFQCKNYSNAIGNKCVQEVYAGKTFYNCYVGVVITNSIFTTGAISLAEATGILLWDREILKQLLVALIE